MEVSDEMVEAACRAHRGLHWNTSEASEKEYWREHLRGILRAALAVMPDQYRAGWIAGRDAARQAAMKAGMRRGDIGTLDAALHAISNMEPPE